MADRILTGDGWQPYTPRPPQQEERFELNPRGVERLFQEQPVDVALKAIDAAIQFQGLRGYQQALQNGQPAEKAMARFGPMIFRKTPGAMGPAIRALTPPAMTPYQAELLKLKREQPPMTPYQRESLDLRKAAVEKVAPEVVTEREKFPAQEGQAASPAEKRSLFGIDALAKDVPAKEFIPARGERTVTRRSPSAPAVSASPPDARPLVTVPPSIATPRTVEEANALSGSRTPFAFMGGNARPAAAAPAAATTAATNFPTATNRKTGERMVFKAGKWQPLRP